MKFEDLEFAIDQMHTEIRVRLKNGPWGSADQVMEIIEKALHEYLTKPNSKTVAEGKK